MRTLATSFRFDTDSPMGCQYAKKGRLHSFYYPLPSFYVVFKHIEGNTNVLRTRIGNVVVIERSGGMLAQAADVKDSKHWKRGNRRFINSQE